MIMSRLRALTVAYTVAVQFAPDLLNAKGKAFNDELCQSWLQALQHTYPASPSPLRAIVNVRFWPRADPCAVCRAGAAIHF